LKQKAIAQVIKKMLYFVGGIIIIGSVVFGLWYFDVFNSSCSGSRPGGSNPPPAPDYRIDTVDLNRLRAERVTQGNPDFITTTENQTRNPIGSSTAIDPVDLINKRMQEITNSYSNSGASGSGSSNQPLPAFGRYDVLDRMRESEGPFSRPGSPASSTDSS